MKIDRETILREIKRTATGNRGIPLGMGLFERETGIKVSAWRGIHRTRWGDALAEAGYEPNKVPDRIDEDRVLRSVIQIVRQFGRLPTQAELMLNRANEPQFPSIVTIRKRFGSMSVLYRALYEFACKNSDLAALHRHA